MNTEKQDNGGMKRGRNNRSRQTHKRMGSGTKKNNETEEQEEINNMFVISMRVSLGKHHLPTELLKLNSYV
jgi:hypothetical protein